jgi:transposase
LEVVEVPSRFEVSDELWAEIEPLIPVRQRRRRYPGRKAIDDRLALNGILHVLHTGIAWEDLPREYGYGSGVTCWRRLRGWQQAGVWDALHQRLLVKLNAAGKIDWSRAAADASHIRALLGGS